MKLRKDINDFLKTIPKDVIVVAATKYVDSIEMRALFNSGINNFGENRVDPLLAHKNKLNDLQITWHFIGHLQKNKANLIVNEIDYLHSLDSIALAKILNQKRNTPLKCFIEVSINEEENKNGVFVENLDSFIEAIIPLKNIEPVGLMMMAIKDSNHNELIRQFNSLYELRNNLEKRHNLKLPYLSMGMSNDYKEAIECHSTHVRLGRILWTM